MFRKLLAFLFGHPQTPYPMSSFGIYAITNTVTGRAYIGATGSSFQERWRMHKWKLRKGTHENPELSRDWDIYGEGVFEFTILEVINRHEDVPDRELAWHGPNYDSSMRYDHFRKPGSKGRGFSKTKSRRLYPNG